MEFNIVAVIGYAVGIIIIIALASWVIIKWAVTSLFKKVETLTEDNNKLNTKVQSLEFRVANCENENEELKVQWKANNDSLRALNSTIGTFDLNARQQHQEIKTLVSDNTKVMQEVVNLLNKK